MLVPALLIGSVAWVAGPGLVEEFSELGSALVDGINEIQQGIGERLPNFGDDAQRLAERLRAEVMENVPRIATGVIAGASAVAEGIAAVFLGLALLFFFVKDGDRMADSLARSLPDRLGEQARTGPWNRLYGRH
jgi:predicted PurR-regulated permease PerM